MCVSSKRTCFRTGTRVHNTCRVRYYLLILFLSKRKKDEKYHLLKKRLVWLPTMRSSSMCCSDRATREHFSHANRMKQLFEESAQLHFPQKSLSRYNSQSRVHGMKAHRGCDAKRSRLPFEVQSVNRTGYDCHYGKVKYHAQFICVCLQTAVLVDRD